MKDETLNEPLTKGSLSESLLDVQKRREGDTLSIVGPTKPAPLPKGILEQTVKLTPMTQKKQG